MEALDAAVGMELELDVLGDMLVGVADRLPVEAVGAHHITCSDETEWECVATMHGRVAMPLLPELSPGRRAAFRTINLGARYEAGSTAIAEEHYAAAAGGERVKLMLVKLNAHVGQRNVGGRIEYGRLHRYGHASTCCGALAAMMQGANLPAIQQLSNRFTDDGIDRLAELTDPALMPAEHRALAAAMVNARLQTRAAVVDIESRPPASPTHFLLLACVTINRPDHDTEVLVGHHRIDWTAGSPQGHYIGLDAQPRDYRIRHDGPTLHVEQW